MLKLLTTCGSDGEGKISFNIQ